MVRITSGMVRRNYQNGLMNAQARLQAANMTNTNYKKFQKVSEDPSGASKAFQIRRELSRATTYKETAKDLQGRLETAEDCILNIQTKVTSVYEKTIAAANGTMSSDERKIYGEELRALQKAILQDMNTSYSGQHLFGGAATGTPPLTVDANGKLMYRGVSVDGPVTADFEKQMQAFCDESVLIDFGYGINADSTESGFNVAQPALDFLGYGTDADSGLSNNLYNLVGEMADYLEGAGENFDANEFSKYQKQFEGSQNRFLTKLTNLGSKSETINYTLTRLDSSILSLQEKQSYVESVDPAEALSDWKWQEFAYRSALAIGTKILQPTLLDYMN